ncbi:TetR/AcrR family transcriptional regulator [Rhizosaccharibacter radicis]|uniref:TetR/AcrR family transcriptional regulator n=1 Tax=Rhizosaccharibacter radicis TaxID=2782605 RepID=A0ABT1W2Y5_9PROT|nr:TetR/AcrR family transcriptional regulator [Acetobacteraceae bacterium KSS12]
MRKRPAQDRSAARAMIGTTTTGTTRGRRPRTGTRERVLDIACALLNENGSERVTTRSVADAAGINEGNLYYHFRTKEALVLALFERFEGDASALLGGGVPDATDPSLYQNRLRDWFVLTWRYRFLFRDGMILRALAPALAPRLRRLSGRLQDETRLVLAAMQEGGLLRIAPAELDQLLANLWIVSSYWISYLVTLRGVRRISPRHLGWGFAQVQALYRPFLTPVALAWVAAQGDAARPVFRHQALSALPLPVARTS